MAWATRSMGAPQLSRRCTVTSTLGPGRSSASASLGSQSGAALAAVTEQGVDDGVAGDQDWSAARPLAQQGRARGRGGRVVDLGQAVGQPAVDLLGEGAVDVVGPQTRLHVRHGDHAVVGGQGGGEGGGGVAVHQDHVGLRSLQERIEPFSTAEVMWPSVCRSRMILRSWSTGSENVVDHLVEHLAMLPGEAGDHAEGPAALQLQHDRSHLDGLRPGSEGDEQRMVRHASSPFRGVSGL